MRVPGLDPGICRGHPRLCAAAQGVDGRDEPGHDDRVVARMSACDIPGTLSRILLRAHPGYMNIPMHARLLALIASSMLLAGSAAAQDGADGFPHRPIHIVVPFPPAGPTDILCRVIAQRMSED